MEDATGVLGAGGMSCQVSKNLLELPLGECYNYFMSIDCFPDWESANCEELR